MYRDLTSHKQYLQELDAYEKKRRRKRMIDKKDSYTAADNLPIKLIRDETVRKGIEQGKILPIHPQVIPTNKCNMKCSFV